MNRLLLLFAIALCAVQYVYTLSIEIKPGEVDCYYEDLEVGERVTISYEVTYTRWDNTRLDTKNPGFMY